MIEARMMREGTKGALHDLIPNTLPSALSDIFNSRPAACGGRKTFPSSTDFISKSSMKLGWAQKIEKFHFKGSALKLSKINYPKREFIEPHYTRIHS